MIISREQARSDIERVMSQFGTVGVGTEKDRAAQLVIQAIGVLERRLGKPEVIKMLYINNPAATKTLPTSVYEISQGYSNGSIPESEARQRLQDVSREYEAVFQEMGIKPQTSVALFGKR